MTSINREVERFANERRRFLQPRQDVEQKIVYENRIITEGQSNPTQLQEIFGMPPDDLLEVTNRKIKDSMPVCHFSPSIPNFTRGLDLFFLQSAWDTNLSGDPSYTALLKEHGFVTPNSPGQGIKVAYLADNFPTDTFTNEYGENFLQKFTDVASEGAASISQFMGTKSAYTALSRLAEPIGGMLPTNFLGLNFQDLAKKGVAGIQNAARGALNAANLQNAAGMIDRLAAGARIDFPQVWKSSGFQPSYTLTVRLFNPNPRSVESTKRYIVGPIVALMLLAVPITQDGSTYSWPFLHKITSPGIFELNPGFIGNITVIKGGDQQQISLQQRLGIVDVRIDVGSLFSTMVAGGTKIQQKTRPTVRKYIDHMINPSPLRHEVFDRQGHHVLDSQANLRLVQYKRSIALEAARKASQTEGRKVAQEKEDSGKTADDRVSRVIKALGDRLADELPAGFKLPF